MATKRAREERVREDKERRYGLAANALNKFSLVAIGIGILFLITYLFNFAYIHNTGMNNGKGGSEVWFSGFNAFFAAISGGYESSAKIFGDISVPFYYYAKTYVPAICVTTMIALFFVVANIVLSIVSAAVKKPIFNLISTGLWFVATVLVFVAFITALSMKNSQILPIYCSGNPACSIRSLAIIPALVSLCGTVISAIASIKYLKAKTILK